MIPILSLSESNKHSDGTLSQELLRVTVITLNNITIRRADIDVSWYMSIMS